MYLDDCSDDNLLVDLSYSCTICRLTLPLSPIIIMTLLLLSLFYSGIRLKF